MMAGMIGIFMTLIYILLFIIWAWTLIDILKSDFKDGFVKLIWLLVVFFLPFIGFILYIFIGRKQKVR